MRYPKWFARWRLQVWDNRLTDARKEWNRASVVGPVVDAVSPVASSETLEQFWERQVTKAMVKRVLWRKRLGIKPLRVKPVRRGGPYVVRPHGEDGPELFVPYEKPMPKLPDPFRYKRDWRNH